MKNIIVLMVLCGVLIVAIIIGMQRVPQPKGAASARPAAGAVGTIPSIGRIQILNGCGVAGAANKVGDCLRANGFDVKFKGNAPTSNYPFTLIVSRQQDLSVARQVGAALSVDNDKVILMRTGDETYDVTVFVGSDYPERIK